MKNLSIITVASSLFILTSCDEITNPYPDVLDDGSTLVFDNGINLDSTSLEQLSWEKYEGNITTKRNFIVEEFTGIRCQACPPGSKILVILDSVYGEQVLPVSIHAGSFAVADPDTNKRYGLELRVMPEGEEIKNTFNPANEFPRGIVSRLTPLVEGKDNWRTTIDQYKDDPQTAIIDLDVWYAPNEKYIRVIIDYEFLFDSPEDHNLQVYIVEDNIVGWQLDGPVLRSDYNHKYVMRRAVNGTWGSTALPAVSDELYHKEYVLIKNNKWKKKDLKIVVYLSNRNTKEIIQANQVKLKL